MKVLATPEVRLYLKELSRLLYEKDYFGYLDYAEKYVEELFSDIKNSLPIRPCRPAPPYFDKYGRDMWYATFRKNRRTVWYAFFSRYDDNGETVWLVRHIDNNHVVAQHL
jgi:hypothetical protein